MTLRCVVFACLLAVAGAACAAAPYYVRVAGTPSPINCGPTTFFFGFGGTLSWSFMNGSSLTADATAYINGVAQGTEVIAVNTQTGSTGLEAINQSSISYPAQAIPYALAVEIVPRDPYTDGARVAFICTASGGTGFSTTVIPGADANLEVAPASLSFPGTTVGTTAAALSATVTNTGNADAPGVTVGVGNSLDFAVAGTTCGATIGPGASCTVSVAFSPRAAGPRSATVTVARDFGPGVSFAVSGTGLAQLVIPAQVLLGAQAVGTTAAPQALTVTNASSTTVTVSRVTSSNATEFPVTTTCASLAPGAACTIGVAFAPAVTGPRAATITVVSDGLGSPQTIAVSAVGIPGSTGAGELALPAMIAFGDQAVGTSSAPRVVTVTGTGSVAVTVAGVASSVPSEFSVSGNTCATVQPGAQCTFSVTFTPAAAGARAAAITVASNGAGSPQRIDVAGNGTAAPAPGQLSLSGSLAFGEQAVGTTGAARIVTVTNAGGAAVTVGGVTSSAPSEFAVAANDCTSLAAGASCTFGVTFSPAAAGARTGAVTVTSNGVGSPQTLSASGTGIAPGQGRLAVDSQVDAGTVLVGAGSGFTVTVVNVGTQAVQVASVASGNPGEFAITAWTCAALAPGAACALSGTFAPEAAGPRSAAITIVSDGAGSPQVVTVAGVGVQALEIVEYRHAEWGHYFVTGIADEIAKLDGGAFAGWARTGLKFKALPLGTPGWTAVCRFFSTAFGERSSHFYTPLANECEIVKRKPEWQFEDEVFGVAVPDGDGRCTGATVPVYRLYNDGQGGSPNHRYTTELAVRAQMMAAGWIPEGYGDLGVIMCAPR